ncbi:MAG: thioredoxin [Verrucomicrobiota bacterium]|jgi:thioredoxin 1
MKLFLGGKTILIAAVTLTALLFFGCDNHTAMNQSTAVVKHITQGEFEAEVTRCTNLVVADFYATWCGSCRQLAPMLERQATNYAGQIKFVKLNVDESPGIAQNFQVLPLPTLVFFRDGKVAGRYSEFPNETNLQASLTAFVAGK